MARIGARNTGPELDLRRALRAAGLHYQLRRALPGSPDLTLGEPRVAIFVHGCFWHGCPKHYQEPRTRAAFWKEKLKQNRLRDRRVTKELRKRGWKVLVIWECDVENDLSGVVRRIASSLASRPTP